MSQFQKLLADLEQAQAGTETLAKSLPAGGEGAGAGAGAGGEGGEGADAGGEGAAVAGAAAGTNGGQAAMTKSLQVTLPDGSIVEAEDGTELVKALTARLGDTESALEKAMGFTLQVIGKQNEMIKSLSDKVAALSGEGRGRKTVIAVHEKNGQAGAGAAAGGEGPLAKGGDTITADDFMLKANAAFDQKLITGVQLTTADVCLREGHRIPTEILSKVAQAKSA